MNREPLTESQIEQINSSDRFDAIRLYRQIIPCSLKEAMDAVDVIQSEHNPFIGQRIAEWNSHYERGVAVENEGGELAISPPDTVASARPARKSRAQAMTLEEYHEICEFLGLRQYQVAELFGVGWRQVARWKSGQTAIPYYCAKIMRLLRSRRLSLRAWRNA